MIALPSGAKHLQQIVGSGSVLATVASMRVECQDITARSTQDAREDSAQLIACWGGCEQKGAGTD